MKNSIIFLLFITLSNNIFGQEKSILKILNHELKKEVKNQLKSPNFSGDTISIVKPFTINDQKILSFEIKKLSPYFSGYQIIRQEVPMNRIKKIGKDINIILETDDNGVVTTYTSVTSETKVETVKGHLFFLYLSNEKQNEDIGIEIQKAFEKAGISINKEYWYD